MTTQTISISSVLPIGVNHGNQFYIYGALVGALANNETLTISLVDASGAAVGGVMPMHWTFQSSATPGVSQTNIAFTSHNRTTGVTVFTASGAVADASKYVIGYIGATAT